MRTPILFALAALAAITLSSPAEAAGSTAEGKRPNVLLIVADDAGFGDYGFSGAITRTPNLDRLAEAGTLFTRFHASPVCSVTRAMLLTGNDPHDIGLGAFDYALYPPAKGKEGYEGYLTRTTVTIAELLKQAGYGTYLVGKWHLGGTAIGGEGPQEWGFDHSYGIYTGGSNQWNQGVFHVDMHDPAVVADIKAGRISTEPFFEDGKPVTRPRGVFSDDLYTGKMINYLEEARKADKPFFAYLAYTTPHAPVQAPDFLIDKYTDYFYQLGFEGLKQARWESQKKAGIIPNEAPLPNSRANPLLGKWSDLGEEEKKLQARMMATYAAMLESQDYQIGLLLNYLQETGRLDDTLIVYLSDNGPEGLDIKGELSSEVATRWVQKNFSQLLSDVGRGNYFGFIGTNWANSATGGLSWWKWFIGEGGVRVPLIIKLPKLMSAARTGEKVADFVSVQDVPMTILDAVGIKHPVGDLMGRKIKAPMGVSIKPFLAGEANVTRLPEQWYAFELFGNSYVVSGNHKAIKVRTGMYGDGAWHLYDIVNDPGETTPLDSMKPELLKDLIGIYRNYAVEKQIVPVKEDWSPWHGFPDD